jgi:hypothetical protein
LKGFFWKGGFSKGAFSKARFSKADVSGAVFWNGGCSGDWAGLGAADSAV